MVFFDAVIFTSILAVKTIKFNFKFSLLLFKKSKNLNKAILKCVKILSIKKSFSIKYNNSATKKKNMFLLKSFLFNLNYYSTTNFTCKTVVIFLFLL